jgi:hypothetical protein
MGGIGMTPLFSIESRHYCLLVDIHFAKYSQVDEVLADLPTADNNLRSFQTHKIDHGLCHQCGLCFKLSIVDNLQS